MAELLEGCDHSPVMWGKIGDFIIQRTRSGKMYIRKKFTPKNPRTQAQQNNRNVMKEGVFRWKIFEKESNKDYWDRIAKEYNFRDSYRAFLSSFLMSYQAKFGELNDSIEALNYVKDTNNFIAYTESPQRKVNQLLNQFLIQKAFVYQSSVEFELKRRISLQYLKFKNWNNRTSFGLLPYANPFVEKELQTLGLIPLQEED